MARIRAAGFVASPRIASPWVAWGALCALSALGPPALADSVAPLAPAATSPAVTLDDVRAHVAALASDRMEGRQTGEPGGRAAEAYAASVFEGLGLEPAGDGGSYFNAFEFSSGLKLGPGNALTARFGEEPGREILGETPSREKLLGAAEEVAFPVNLAWRPLGFSKRGETASHGVIFAGYGVVAEAEPERGLPAYDSFGQADLSGKWALVWRGAPPGASRERRRQLMSGAPIFRKAAEAARRGAAGLIVAAGPGVGYREALPELASLSLKGAGEIPVIAVTEKTAARLLREGGLDPELWAERLAGGGLDGGDAEGAPRWLRGVWLSARVEIVKNMARGRNILARLRLGGPPGAPPVVVGAHIDHLGRGGTYASMARADEEGMIHYGADDNASGVAALFEIAEHMAAERAAGRLRGARDVIFAAWAAEEYGLIGSRAYLDGLLAADGAERLTGLVSSYLNMDMVGRMEADLRLSGMGSSDWTETVAAANAPLDLPLTLAETPYVPTDASAFYRAGAPVLSITTGSHPDYHTPRDRADRLNYHGIVQVATLIARLAEAEAEAPTARRVAFVPPPLGRDFAREEPPIAPTLGLSPIFEEEDGRKGEPGVALEGVIEDGPAAAAGARAGDRVTGLGGEPIAGPKDFVEALKKLAPGRPAELTLERGARRLRLTVTPAARE